MAPSERLSLATFMDIVMQVGSTIGLNDNERGQIGAIMIDPTSFWTIGPPADKL